MKSKPQQLTYTLAPVSARSSSHYNHHDQISCVTSGTPSKTFTNPQQDLRLLRTKIPMEEAILQLSDLNTSGANTTICEYVKILGDNNNHLAGEDIVSSLHSSWSEDYKKQIERIRRNNEGRIGRRDGFDQNMDLQRLRKKGSTNYKSLEKQLASKPVATAPGRDDSATVIEFTDFIGYTEGNPVEKENVPEVVKREKLVVGKIAIPPKARSQEKKNSFQQQSMISKIAGGSSHQNISSSTSASITARRLREEPNVNRSQGFEAATLSSRLMNSRTERENYQTQPNQPSSGSLIKPLIQLTSPNLNAKKSKKRTEAVYKSALSHRNSQSSNISSLQNPNRSSQKKFNPVPAPVSRSVQAIVTPRGHYYVQNDENQKPLASIKEESNKLIENKRAQSKGEIKSKRDSASKVMKATKIDLVEMDISKKSGQRRRNERVEECTESIEVIYGMLKKAFKEKKEEISHSEHCIQKLEGLKTYMIEAISSINGLKSE